MDTTCKFNKYQCHECKRIFELTDIEYANMLLFSVKKGVMCNCGSMRIDILK